MSDNLLKILNGEKILILGFGKEGISTYNLLKKILPGKLITIADKDEYILERIDFKLDNYCETHLGDSYLSQLENFDVIFKSPGISNILLKDKVSKDKITSQTDLFLQLFASQIIGITGTKGKSTTSSLIKHVISQYYKDVILVGNIGIPPFDLIENITEKTKIVFELSSHQLDDISVAPHISVILNLFEEHLDHYESYSKYQLAKFNITKYQSENDWIVLNTDDDIINGLYKNSGLKRNLLEFSIEKEINPGAYLNGSGQVVFNLGDRHTVFDFSKRMYLPGNHNLKNMMAAVCVCKIFQIPDEIITEAVLRFKGLEHRLEYVGEYGDIHFYNDSIATIPEATIEAMKTLKDVDTLILGGKDRGIDYNNLIKFLAGSNVNNLIFLGEAGKRIYEGINLVDKTKSKKCFLIMEFNEASQIIKKYTKPGSICLLSPAAASYDMFNNFEERGEAFKKIARNI